MVEIAAAHMIEIDQPLFSICIWTDILNGYSAVAADTRTNSDRQREAREAYRRAKYDYFIKLGDSDSAASWTASTDRSNDPADFQFPRIIMIEHDWDDSDLVDGHAEEIYSTLERVRDESMSLLEELHLDPDAEIGVTSDYDWFDKRRRIRAAQPGATDNPDSAPTNLR